jgi:XRE family transcriptional regulator, master regulator for biofilm formation
MRKKGMKDGKAFGRRVERMRAKRRLTTQELAEQTGLSYQSLWRIERGTQGEPGVFTAAKIAKALGCSVDYLVGLYEDEDSERLAAAVA